MCQQRFSAALKALLDLRQFGGAEATP